MVMLYSNKILYLRYLPASIIFSYVLLIFVVYLRYHFNELFNISKFHFVCILILSCVWIYDRIWVVGMTPIGFVDVIVKILCATVILTLSLRKKEWLLSFFSIIIQSMVGIGLIGWILFLFNFPLPYYTVDTNDFYTHTIYYVFNLNGLPNLQLLPRYAGPFLEPGHIGTMCVFLLYYQKFNLKNVGNIILLLGILFSLSLAAYGLMIGAILLTLLNKRKWIYCISICLFFTLCGIGAMVYNDGDNVINQAIVLRLEMDESGEIAGNNRTSSSFDRAYQLFLESDDIWFGVGRKAFGTRGNGTDNITIGCATYKRYFFLRGIIGSILILSFLVFYFYKYRNKESLGFLIVYIIANCIRDYPNMEMWLYFYLLVIPVLGKIHKYRNLIL